MPLDIYLTASRPTEVFNQTLRGYGGRIADELGIGVLLYNPKRAGIATAGQLIGPLEAAVKAIYADVGRYQKLMRPKDDHSFSAFCEFLRSYLAACKKDPDATVEVWF